MTKIYRACGTELRSGAYMPSRQAYTTAEEAWMRAQDDGIYPAWIESKTDYGWTEEPYTPPEPSIYIDIYYLYAERIIGDKAYSFPDR